MSLNVSEQRIFEYAKSHPDELRFWQEKVRLTAVRAESQPAAASRLDLELWRYYEERCAVVPSLRDPAHREGLRRTSMRNLAELMLRLWTEPRPKKKSPAPEGEDRIISG